MFLQHQTNTVAILVRAAEGSPPFVDELFCRRLSLESHRYGLNIIVLAVANKPSASRLTQGYAFNRGEWNIIPLPAVDLIMDRCLLPLPRTFKQQLQQLVSTGNRHQARYWSASLPGKWKVYRALSADTRLRDLLAPTTLLQSDTLWEQWLARWPKGIFFKPVSGTHGKDTFRLYREDQHTSWIMEGRNTRNELVHRTFERRQDVSAWLDSHKAGKKMILQPYLELSHQGRPFDVRALVQKNGHGRWSLTGCMVREGPAGTLTSNLHGGGKAYPVYPYLLERYGSEQSNALLETIRQTAARIPTLLESRFGRLAELGLDFGADVHGRLWLIEVNSRPGRSSFAEAGDPRMYSLTYTRPLAYARYLLQQHVLTDVKRPLKMPNTSSTAGLKPIPIHGG
ncbi:MULTISPECIES: YheC/YheD family protein [Paenibacillus]|uniref:YheC/D-like protein n=1 Tax=Paenibacillus pabuli TaxID=1472 RepID=A0A855YBK8_9BACL|nr:MULTISPECIES: YheC/YheD family protein [Paenibacillus]PWW41062.1 YheC/D-like protein [Paenibacillus pabuli]PXW12186.1 YheC/D-like protein [Paenibacillus taichungensis]